ncbi:MAG TPA: hemerythrin domain-containing protein [Thermoplasmata archaeon]|nr:hemerythrin domain-containing protein [Thermoplasmata archaeon]
MTATEDLFTPIHKGLRSMIYSLSSRLQTNDFADLSATKALATDLENEFEVARSAGCVLCVLAHHATDEESVIFPAVSEVGRNLIVNLIQEHHDLTRRELAIGKAAHTLLGLESPAARIEAGIALNRAANELFAAYITHMNREDAELVPLMREHFSVPQMAAMRGTIISNMPPDRLFNILGWMLPSLNVSELSEVLSGMSKGAPAPVIKAIVDLCSAKVDPTRWKEVRLRTGL